MALELAGIKRSLQFSPNHTGNDAAIFQLTSQELEKLGCTIKEYTEGELIHLAALPQSFVFTMARSKQAVYLLQQMESGGTVVMNSAYGIEKCYRTNMTNGIIGQQIPYPQSFIVPTFQPANAAFDALGGQGFWIKRGDFHAIHKEDVTFVRNKEEGNEILQEYSVRGIAEAVISRHLSGDLVKFYGVRDTGFFYWFYPFDLNHSKFNNEAKNGSARYHHFDIALLKSYAGQAATALDVHIYGGDAIVAGDGSMHIIDLNDWPSFAPCRQEAAPHIARCIYQKCITPVTIPE